MRSNPLRRTIPFLLAALLLAGCASDLDEPLPTSTAAAQSGCPVEVLRDNVVLVVGTHANMPRPVLTPAGGSPTSPTATCALTHLLEGGGTLTLIGVDGSPKSRVTSYEPVMANNTPGRERLTRQRWSELDEYLLHLTAQSEGADLHRAVELALRAAARNPEETVVFVLDNGLSDRGAVDLTQPSWSTSEPQDIVDAVKQSGQSLQQSPGTQVVLSGLAMTMPPQPELNVVQERVVRGIWESLLFDAGVEVMVDIAGWSMDQANPTEFETGIVEPVEPEVFIDDEPEEIIVLAPGELRFQPDEADPEITDSALARLEKFARTQAGDERRQIYVIGRTDSTPTTRWADNDELSQARADSVKDVLVAFGADPDRIISVGQGYAACPEDGGLDRIAPGKRAQNRVVIVGELAPDEEVPSGCFLPPRE